MTDGDMFGLSTTYKTIGELAKYPGFKDFMTEHFERDWLCGKPVGAELAKGSR